jgi:hypothetical protein
LVASDEDFLIRKGRHEGKKGSEEQRIRGAKEGKRF